jgi:hypothetical protein
MPITKEQASANGKKGKGVKRNKTRQWDDIGTYLTVYGSERLLTELDALEGKEYVSAFKDILEYFKPKLARKDIDITSGGDKLQITPLLYAPDNDTV